MKITSSGITRFHLELKVNTTSLDNLVQCFLNWHNLYIFNAYITKVFPHFGGVGGHNFSPYQNSKPPKQFLADFKLTLTGRARGFAACFTMLKTTA